MALTYKQEIKKLVVDKLLIALVLAFFGLIASILIEKFKSKQEFSTELNRVRVQKIAEVWESVFIFESKLNNLYNELNDNIEDNNSFNGNSIDSIKTYFDIKKENVFKDIPVILNLCEKNRFWIGEESYKEVKNYLVITRSLNDVIQFIDVNRMIDNLDRRIELTQDEEKLKNQLILYKKALEQSEKSRMSIIKARDRVMND